jgi:hypothetical protein
LSCLSHHFLISGCSNEQVIRATSVRRFLRGGSEGNARVTATTGLDLLVLLAIEDVTLHWSGHHG